MLVFGVSHNGRHYHTYKTETHYYYHFLTFGSGLCGKFFKAFILSIICFITGNCELFTSRINGYFFFHLLFILC